MRHPLDRNPEHDSTAEARPWLLVGLIAYAATVALHIASALPWA